MVSAWLDEGLRRRARDGLAGYVRAGVNAGRYVCLILSDEDPVSIWEVRLSYVDHSSWDDWTSSDRGWDEMAAEIARWNVIWAPEHLNDRVLFRAFSFPEAGLDPDWVVRQRAVRASVEALTPVVPGTNDVRVALTSEYLHAMIMRVVSDHEFAAPQEGLGRLSGRERRQLREGQLSQLRDVFSLLWEAGHALTVVPLGASLTVATIDDPWLPFMDSASS